MVAFISCGFMLALFIILMMPGTGPSTPCTPKTRKHRKGKALTSKEKVILLNTWEYFKGTSPKMTNEKADVEVAKATGISQRSVLRARVEQRETGEVTTPGKSRPKAKGKRSAAKYDDFTLSAVRRKVHAFFEQNEPPTLDKLKREIDLDESLPDIPRSSLFRILKDLGFRYKKRGRNAMLIEKDDIISWRHRYLRNIRKFRKDGRPIFYLDETWANAGHTQSRVWEDTTICSSREAFLTGLSPGLKDPTGKGGRLIILHVGNEHGFIPGADLVFRSGGKLADYHGEMNGDTFEKWFKDMLIPKLPENSVIVMDNASYHSVRQEAIPTSNSRKKVMQDWLTTHQLPWTDDMVKVELYRLVKENRQRFLKYKIDTLAEQSGHQVLRLPPYHCQLNPIEMVWTQVKNYVAANNKTFKMADVELTVQEAFSAVTPENWQNYVNHAIKEEKKCWNLDGLMDDVVENFIISVGGESDSDSEDETGPPEDEEFLSDSNSSDSDQDQVSDDSDAEKEDMILSVILADRKKKKGVFTGGFNIARLLCNTCRLLPMCPTARLLFRTTRLLPNCPSSRCCM